MTRKSSGNSFANSLQCARNQCCLAREFTHFNALLVNTERYTPFPLKIQDKQNIAADQLTNSGKSQSSRCFMHHFRRCVSSLLR
ncbi:Uncharacterised protein [Shigella sonnei]|nr:Uncharacterised protein [Shigella sonnei]CSG31970.1 Uncharacterised protein [Shigella sonnei]CSJ58308.1 Uncharacterised protein [Shigella sonnei]CSP42120.1 Uncharacterised protein [Shigella sonnei]CSQ31801.1 Uncharacterised protein [Shigella sonnei]